MGVVVPGEKKIKSNVWVLSLLIENILIMHIKKPFKMPRSLQVVQIFSAQISSWNTELLKKKKKGTLGM